MTSSIPDWSRVARLTLAVFNSVNGRLEKAVDVDLGALQLLDQGRLQHVIDAIFRTPLIQDEEDGFEAASSGQRGNDGSNWRLLIETRRCRDTQEDLPVELLAQVDAETKTKFDDLYAQNGLVTPIHSVEVDKKLLLSVNFLDFRFKCCCY